MKDTSRTWSRRAFLQAGAGAAVGAASLTSVLKAMAEAAAAGPAAVLKIDDRPFKIGVVGCGAQGRLLMKEALKTPGNQIVAICDADAKNLEAAKAIAKDAKTYADFKELCKDANVQAVVIAAPLAQRHPVAMEALNSKKDVFVERMMADSIAKCKEMIVTMAGVEPTPVLQIGHALRYHPSIYIGKKFIDKAADGGIGKMTKVTCQWLLKAGEAKPANAMAEVPNDQLDLVNLFLHDVEGPVPTAVTGAGALDSPDATFEYADGLKVQCKVGAADAFKPEGWETMTIVDGTCGRIVIAQNAKYAGLFILKSDQKEELWFNLAHKATEMAQYSNIVPADSKAPIVLGKPTPDSIFVAGLDAARLLHEKTSQPLRTPQELEMLEFKSCCLDRKMPAANALIGLRSAVLSLKAAEAVEKKTKVEIPAAEFEIG